MTDLVTFKRNLTAMVERGELALPSTVNQDAFKNAAIIAFQNNPELRNASPESVFTALRHLAGSGLMPDGRESAIVIYKGKAQAQPMVSGLRKIARNSGQVKAMWDDVVYEGETILARYDDEGVRVLEHVNEDGTPLDMMKRGGEIVGAYASAKLKDGTVVTEVMTKEQIEKRRRASPNQKGDKPTYIWADWYEEMARKTAVRALCKQLPMSTEDYLRIEADPTFREVEMRDVSPKETTAERLRREKRERIEYTEVEPEPKEVQDEEIPQ